MSNEMEHLLSHFLLGWIPQVDNRMWPLRPSFDIKETPGYLKLSLTQNLLHHFL